MRQSESPWFLHCAIGTMDPRAAARPWRGPCAGDRADPDPIVQAITAVTCVDVYSRFQLYYSTYYPNSAFYRLISTCVSYQSSTAVDVARQLELLQLLHTKFIFRIRAKLPDHTAD